MTVYSIAVELHVDLVRTGICAVAVCKKNLFMFYNNIKTMMHNKNED